MRRSKAINNSALNAGLMTFLKHRNCCLLGRKLGSPPPQVVIFGDDDDDDGTPSHEERWVAGEEFEEVICHLEPQLSRCCHQFSH